MTLHDGLGELVEKCQRCGETLSETQIMGSELHLGLIDRADVVAGVLVRRALDSPDGRAPLDSPDGRDTCEACLLSVIEEMLPGLQARRDRDPEAWRDLFDFWSETRRRSAVDAPSKAAPLPVAVGVTLGHADAPARGRRKRVFAGALVCQVLVLALAGLLTVAGTDRPVLRAVVDRALRRAPACGIAPGERGLADAGAVFALCGEGDTPAGAVNAIVGSPAFTRLTLDKWDEVSAIQTRSAGKRSYALVFFVRWSNRAAGRQDGEGSGGVRLGSALRACHFVAGHPTRCDTA